MNILISSKNRDNNSSIASASYNLPAGIIQCKNDEYLTVRLKGFSMIKSFLAVMDGINNQFNIIHTDADGIVSTYELSIAEGYYNINNLLSHLQSLVPSDIVFSFNQSRNSLTIKNNSTTGDLYSFMSINCGVLLGCVDLIEYDITPSGVELPSYVNLSGFNNMFIEVTGDINLDYTSCNNVVYKDFKQSQIMGLINLTNVPYYSLIDVSNCSEFRLTNRAINNIKIRLINDNGIEFKRLSDYTIAFEFKKHQRIDKDSVVKGLSRLEAYLSRLFVIASRYYLET